MMIHILDLLGTAVFAITGAIAARRKEMDIFGVLVIAIVTAVGGGTFRDVLLGIHPIFWIAKTSYLSIALCAAVITIPLKQFFDKMNHPILILDALGLAAFAVIGTAKGLSLHAPIFVSVLMGMLTGVGGGMLRDIMCAEIPIVLRKEIYASAAFFGAAVYALLAQLHIPAVATFFSLMTTVTLRMTGICWHWRLPFRKPLRKVWRKKFTSHQE